MGRGSEKKGDQEGAENKRGQSQRDGEIGVMLETHLSAGDSVLWSQQRRGAQRRVFLPC